MELLVPAEVWGVVRSCWFCNDSSPSRKSWGTTFIHCSWVGGAKYRVLEEERLPMMEIIGGVISGFVTHTYYLYIYVNFMSTHLWPLCQLIIINFCCLQGKESYTLKLYMPGNRSLPQGFDKWVTNLLFSLSSLKGLFPIKYPGIWTCTPKIYRAKWGHFMGANSRKEEGAICRTDKMEGKENWEKYKILK